MIGKEEGGLDSCSRGGTGCCGLRRGGTRKEKARKKVLSAACNDCKGRLVLSMVGDGDLEEDVIFSTEDIMRVSQSWWSC